MRALHQSNEGASESMKSFGLMLVAIALFACNSILSNANASELGRLFYTPQQRAQLETQKISGETVDGVKRNFIVVNGVIQKQGGNRIVWINGAQQPAGHSNEKTPSTVPVTVPGKTQPVQIKVGQRLILDTPAPNNSDGGTPNSANDDD